MSTLKRKFWTRGECISAVKLACDGCNEAVRIKEYDSLHFYDPDTYPSKKTVTEKLGSWSNAIKAAGYPTRSRGQRGQRDYQENLRDLAGDFFA